MHVSYYEAGRLRAAGPARNLPTESGKWGRFARARPEPIDGCLRHRVAMDPQRPIRPYPGYRGGGGPRSASTTASFMINQMVLRGSSPGHPGGSCARHLPQTFFYPPTRWAVQRGCGSADYAVVTQPNRTSDECSRP